MRGHRGRMALAVDAADLVRERGLGDLELVVLVEACRRVRPRASPWRSPSRLGHRVAPQLAGQRRRFYRAGAGEESEACVTAQAAGARSPKIAEPMRTWVAPQAMAASKSSLMPMERPGRPWRAARLARRVEVRDGVVVGRRDRHQAEDRQVVAAAAGGEEGVEAVGVDAGLLRLAAGVDLDEEGRAGAAGLHRRRRACGRGCRGRGCGWRRRARGRGRACWSAAGRRGAARRRGSRRGAAGQRPSASCTRFSPKTRWPASSTARDPVERLDLGDGDEGDGVRRGDRRAARAAAMRARMSARGMRRSDRAMAQASRMEAAAGDARGRPKEKAGRSPPFPLTVPLSGIRTPS